MLFSSELEGEFADEVCFSIDTSYDSWSSSPTSVLTFCIESFFSGVLSIVDSSCPSGCPKALPSTCYYAPADGKVELAEMALLQNSLNNV